MQYKTTRLSAWHLVELIGKGVLVIQLVRFTEEGKEQLQRMLLCHLVGFRKVDHSHLRGDALLLLLLLLGIAASTVDGSLRGLLKDLNNLIDIGKTFLFIDLVTQHDTYELGC